MKLGALLEQLGHTVGGIGDVASDVSSSDVSIRGLRLTTVRSHPNRTTSNFSTLAGTTITGY
jgi:hypothetical protein